MLQVRKNLVDVAVQIDVQSIRVQLGLVMQKIATVEYPSVWPGFVTPIMVHLESGDMARVSPALYLFQVHLLI